MEGEFFELPLIRLLEVPASLRPLAPHVASDGGLCYIAANPDDPDGTYIRQEIARLEGEVGRRVSPTEDVYKRQTPSVPHRKSVASSTRR